MLFEFIKKIKEKIGARGEAKIARAFTPRTAPRAESKLEIYLGVDFGTTFTKVSFQVGGLEGATTYSLKFEPGDGEEAYCLPSVLGYDTARKMLVFTQVPEKDELEAVRYFKYSMIERGVPRNHNLEGGGTRNDPQRLCSAFYIAHVLRMAKTHVMAHRAVKGRAAEVLWEVNMGVPVNDFAALPRPIYDEVLNVAWKLAESGRLAYEMTLADLDAFYSPYVNPTEWSDRLNTVPELYAELVMFLQDRAVDEGFYAAIDIGGGTVDMAVFFKRINHRNDCAWSEVFCVAQEVCPLGYELYQQMLRRTDVETKMRTFYMNLIDVAHTHYPAEMRRAADAKRHFVHFFLGGARQVPFYHTCVAEITDWTAQHWMRCPPFEEVDIVQYLKHRANLDVKGNHRLVISQMLAQPFERMPQLTGHAWNFPRGGGHGQDHAPAPTLAELQDAMYGD